MKAHHRVRGSECQSSVQIKGSPFPSLLPCPGHTWNTAAGSGQHILIWAMKIIPGLETEPYEEELKGLGGCSLEEIGELSSDISSAATWKEEHACFSLLWRGGD